MSLLTVHNLEAGYGPVRVLHGLNFEVAEGSVAVILGPNGAGKTTTLRAISGMIPSRGEVRFADNDLVKLSADRVVRLGVAHVPQGRGTFSDMTVEENLRLGAYTRRDGDFKADIDRWYEFFPRLKERSSQPAGSLSGGEQQMLALSRALMLRPRLLLLDEPSLGLAPIVTRELFDVLRDINRDFGTAMLIVEQNANLALGIANDAYVLETGRIIASGPAEEIGQDDTVRKAYLGY